MSSACNVPAIPQNSESAGQYGKQLLSKMGISTCKTSAEQASISASEDVFGGLAESGSLNAEESADSTAGCEDVKALLNSFAQCVNDVNCNLSETVNTSDITVTSLNNFYAEASGLGSTILYPSECPNGASIDQSSSITLYSQDQLQSQGTTTIASAVKNNLKSYVSSLTNQTSGFGSTPQGAKLLNAVQQQVNDQNIQEAITKAIQKTSITVDSGDNMTFTALDGAEVMIPCVINQASVLNLQLSTVVANTYSEVFQGTLTDYLVQKQQYETTQTNTGAPSAVGTTAKSWIFYIVLGVLVIAVAGVAFAFIKSGGVKDVTSAVAKNPEVLAFRRRGRLSRFR